MNKIASEIIANRLCLRKSAVFNWMAKYGYRFSDVVKHPEGEIITAVVYCRPLGSKK